ncbi:flagellar hook-basal body complex protein [Roseospira marina]|uniref:Flagellar hook protein FlgE n=1 Tax=Roseospira marina TaxID=140057 RepID=A0A5M6I8Y7_9PROT|nr:flagellar hook-basal body complex protein [Roseospira marina]KAA5604651.1 flagellar hook-basal body complex protein [Roseospira marina]MBB4315094.1 flagellar hook protein FlgE [Roseospira marina]MBB5088136.1 flagellar hook protein FlgE [Roseospira marina]
MSVFAALFTSSQAMQTQSHVLTRISDNVANMNTTGYKTFDAHLRESVNHITPRGTYVGVNSVDVRHADAQGIIQSTGRPLDVAINGDGYFVTNPAFDGSGTQHFTRDGATQTALGPDGNAYLVNSSGQFYQGWEAAPDGTVDTTGPLVPVQVEAAGGLAGEPTTEVTFSANINADATKSHTFQTAVWSPPDATGANDSYALLMTWTPGDPGSNAWSVSYTVRAPDGSDTLLDTTTEVTFDGGGQYVGPADPTVVTVPFADGSSSAVTVDLSETTQFGASGFQENYQETNGFPAGRVSQVAFDNFGRLQAQYSNGQSRVLYQLAVADFPAPQNLEDAGHTMFTYREEAGAPDIYGVDTLSTRTAMVAGSVEGSTVDLTREFSNMITTQKAYSTSATVYRTSDEMVRTATALKQ